MVNAVTMDEATQTAVLTTAETWAVADQAEKDLLKGTTALRTVEMRLVTNENGGEGWICRRSASDPIVLGIDHGFLLLRMWAWHG
jgi:hypothetical protein